MRQPSGVKDMKHTRNLTDPRPFHPPSLLRCLQLTIAFLIAGSVAFAQTLAVTPSSDPSIRPGDDHGYRFHTAVHRDAGREFSHGESRDTGLNPAL
jgi:hypothetical protein